MANPFKETQHLQKVPRSNIIRRLSAMIFLRAQYLILGALRDLSYRIMEIARKFGALFEKYEEQVEDKLMYRKYLESEKIET